MRFLKDKKGVIISFIIGVILASSITVYAYSYMASEISYTKPGTNTEISVETALNDLYSNSTKFEKICENGQISKQAGSMETANFLKEIEPNCIIVYKVKVDNDWYGPYAFNYTANEQSVVINAHTSLSCKVYNNKIESISYAGAYKVFI